MEKKESISRRKFLRKSTILASGMPLISMTGLVRGKVKLSWTEARYYKKLTNNKIQCELCPWKCIVQPGRRGHCEVRENKNGTYYSLIYGLLAAYHNDPIEKKPFYHFLPGTTSFSLATAGCNVDCKFCQNWELAQRRPEEIPGYKFSPKEIIDNAKKWDCKSIAYTYNEPTVFAEFIYDTALEGKKKDVRSVIVSNGFISRKPLSDLSTVLDGYKVDLKAFTEKYYRDVVGGRLAPVLDTLVYLKSQSVWTEIVYLTVPTLNDDMKKIQEMVKWILNELGPDVPLHFSRFYPKYKLKNLPPTPVNTLERARKTALDGGLNYVYMGNIPGHEGENTNCPSCGKTLIRRMGYRIYKNNIVNAKCSFCGNDIPGVWS